MLTYEALLEQARLRAMPLTKPRGILREYLQVLILKELCKATDGRRLYLTGGTYLRLAHGLKRFSEDLDFNTDSLTKTAFEKLVTKAAQELKRLNIAAEARFDHWGNILSGQLVFPDIEKQYNIASRFSKKEGIIIKIEANRPKWKIKKESGLIAGFGEMFPCIWTDRGALFADKIDALHKKSRGRHLYDIIFMLANRFPVDTRVLRSLGIEGDPVEAIGNRVKRLSVTELKKQAETLRLFLFDESEAGLVADAKEVLPPLLAQYRKT